MVKEVNSQPQFCWFDPRPRQGIFQEENSSNVLTSIGGIHSAVKKYLGSNLGLTLVLLNGPMEQATPGPRSKEIKMGVAANALQRVYPQLYLVFN